MKGRRWLQGPQYLWKAKEEWPETMLDISLDVGDKEVRREAAVNVVNMDKSAPTDQLTSFFSN